MPNLTSVQMFSSVYDINAMVGRRITRLSNGWLVTSSYYSNKGYFHVSKDNGSTWTQLCWVSNTNQSFSYPCIEAVGTVVHCIFTNTSSLFSISFDAATVTNIDLYGSVKTVVGLGMNYGGHSFVIDNGKIHVAFACQYTETPYNYNNIGYRTGTVSGTTITWAPTAEQVTKRNGSNYDEYSYPNIFINADEQPCIVFKNHYNIIRGQGVGSGSGISCLIRDINNNNQNIDSNWSVHLAYDSQDYNRPQWNPSAIFIPPAVAIKINSSYTKGLVVAAWCGYDSTYTSTLNIKCMASSDGGRTWFNFGVTNERITAGSSIHEGQPSISANKRGEIFIVWEYRATSDTIWNLRKIKRSVSAWGSITTVTSSTTTSVLNPCLLYDPTMNMYEPIYIYKNNPLSSIIFSGSWYLTSISGTDGSIANTATSPVPTYTITDPESTTRSVVEKIDGMLARSYTATSGIANAVNISSRWSLLENGFHTLTIECNGETRTWTFYKIFSSTADIVSLIAEAANDIGPGYTAKLRAALRDLNVQVSDSDDIASMAMKYNSFVGKKYAAGTSTSGSSQSYNSTGGYSILGYPITITGLSFTPKTVVMYNTNGIPLTFFSSDGNVQSSGYNIFVMGPGYGVEYMYNMRLESPASITASGFSLPVASPATCNWIAFE